MSLSKPLTLRHLCHLLNNIIGLFYHHHIVFFTISLDKNTKCYVPEKSAREWPRNKLLSSSRWAWCTTALTITPPCQLLNSLNFFILPNRFLPLWNQGKRARGPAGNRSSPSRLGAPQHYSTTTSPPWLFYFASSFSFTHEPTYFKVI